MIDLWHFSKKRLNIFWQYKNVERDLSTTLNIQRTFTDFARTGQTWHLKLSAASQKSQRSPAGAISGDISLLRVTSSCAGAADAVNLISRQIGSVSAHKELFMGSFLVPHQLPKDQTCLLQQTTFQSQHANSAFLHFRSETLILELKTQKTWQ